jgi:hypothetical protein
MGRGKITNKITINKKKIHFNNKNDNYNTIVKITK